MNGSSPPALPTTTRAPAGAHTTDGPDDRHGPSGLGGAAPPDRFATRLVVAGCSRRKAVTDRPVPALELYQGGCVPALRARLGRIPAARRRIRLLSAEHGLLAADSLLPPYDRRLTAERATELRPQVAAQLDVEFIRDGTPTEVLLIAEPLYLVLIADLLAWPARPSVTWLPDPGTDWPAAADILDRWSWA